MSETNATELKLMTASGTVKAVAGKVWGVYPRGNLASPHDIVLRDGGASGTIKATIRPPNSTSAPPIEHVFPVPLYFATDIYCGFENGTNIAHCSILYE